MLHPTTNWYYVAGLGVAGWAFMASFTQLRIKGKGGSWFTWACLVLGVLACLGSGMYLLKVSEARSVAHFVYTFRFIAFILFIVVMVMAVKLATGAIPDEYHPQGLTMGLAAFAVILPLLLHTGFVPGDVGSHLREGTDNIGGAVVDQTRGAFG